jgi:hypothetical protein
MPPPSIPKPTEDDSKVIKSPNTFTLFQQLTKPLKVGKTYILSFKVKGSQIKNGQANIVYKGSKNLGTGDVISKDERDAVKRDNRLVSEDKVESASYTGGSNWVDVKKEFTVKFDEKDLETVTETQTALIRFIFELTPGSGLVQFDDVKLTEK